MKKITVLFGVVLVIATAYIGILVKEKFDFVDNAITESKAQKINYSQLQISKGKLGPITIGMTVSDVKRKFRQLKVSEESAHDFGFDGGSPAITFNEQQRPIFSLIPKLHTDTILFIIAIDQRLKTTNGLHPKSSVKNILATYPEMLINQDIMNNWEFFQDSQNNWVFNFKTSEEHTIGNYPVLEMPSKPENLEIVSDWIVIK
jgi:hypothetical protein